MRLFRPVGQKELDLISASAWTAFPPRLPEQPIFYPVMNFDYAEQIARDWNSKQSAPDNVGYVTAFDVDDTYVAKFEVKTVGAGALHKELWVPAEKLDAFNQHIVGEIMLMASYRDGRRTDK